MTTETIAGFLRGIMERPDDCNVRLVYADCLEERGQEERAEFIRVQCEIEALPDPAPAGVAPFPAKRLQVLRHRANELLTENYGLRWAMPVLDLMGWSRPHALVGSWIWSRGFMECIGCTVPEWRAHGPAVVLCQPIKRVILSNKKPFRCGLDHDGTGDQQRWTWAFGKDGIHYLPTPEAALQAASRACLGWARHQAGLPFLDLNGY